MMHARRKFYEARTSDPPRSHQALAWIGLLYDVEREAKEKHETAEYEAFVAARHALRGSDRVRSSSSSTPGWKPSGRRCCPRARSARRSSMR